MYTGKETQKSYGAQEKSAETRDRAGDLQIFSLTLSQLSYRGPAKAASQAVNHLRLHWRSLRLQWEMTCSLCPQKKGHWSTWEDTGSSRVGPGRVEGKENCAGSRRLQSFAREGRGLRRILVAVQYGSKPVYAAVSTFCLKK